MNLKDEICSVEYAKRLKALGVTQFTPFQWVEVPYKYNIDSNLVKTVIETETKLVFGDFATIENKIDEWAAFTVGQLFELLPATIDTRKDEPFNNFWFHIAKRNAKNIQYIINYYCDTHQVPEGGDPFFATSLIQDRVYDEKLADALAKMLITLIEKGLVNY